MGNIADYIVMGKVVLCPTCHKMSKTPRQISKEEIPITLVCPHEACRTTFRLTTTMVAKVDPIVSQSVFLNAKVFGEGEDTVSTGNLIDELHQQSEAARLETPPFFERTKNVGRLTIEILDNIEILKNDVEQFRKNVVSFFKDQWRYFERFKNCWDEQHIQEWCDFPFTVIPVVSEDILASEYGRFIMAPKFFHPQFGFKVPQAHGGMRVELINQFSRMNFPLDTMLCEKFSLPPELDLRVAGNKIIGSSLALCYKDIPGLGPDNDNTEDFVSVYIKDSARARQWLANHGVIPWGPNPVKQKDMNLVQPPTSITDSKIMNDAWEKFKDNGRLGVFWTDAMLSRRFATLIGMMLKGVTVVFVAGGKERMAWDSTYGLTGDRIQRMGNEFCFFQNGDPVVWDAVMRTKSTIIDMHGGLDTEILSKMYDYPGRLILLCPDPILDFHSINILASRVHGLCGYSVFENADFGDLEVKKQFAGGLFGLVRSIRGFREEWPDFRLRKPT